MGTKDAAPSLATATAVGAEAPMLKSTAKTPKKPKGWKKWKRRLSQVFTVKKKKSKHAQQYSSMMTATTGGGDPTLVSAAPRDRALRQSKLRPSEGSTDESPEGSEKDADRRSVDSREWRRKPGAPSRRSAESRSASEPTDEEWEAEQHRLARRDDGGEDDDDDDERSHAEEEEEELEYDDEAYEREGEGGDQSDDDEQEELQEDVYDYEEQQEVSQPEETKSPLVVGADQKEESEMRTPIEARECHEPLASPLEINLDNEMEDTTASVDEASDGESSTAVVAVKSVDQADGGDGEDEEMGGGDSQNECLYQVEMVPDGSYDEDGLDGAENVTEPTVESVETRREEDPEQNLQQEEDDDDKECEEEGEYEVEEEQQQLEEDESEELEEEEPDNAAEELQHENAKLQLDGDIEQVDASVAYASPTADAASQEELASLLLSIPLHMKVLYDVVAVWCSEPDAPTTVDTRLLIACVKRQKWALAQQLAEKLRRSYDNHTHRRGSAAATESLLDALLTHCAA